MASQIKIWLDKIKTAVYGIEVRDAIHDSIAECYDNVTDAKTLADDAVSSANAAAVSAQTKAELADASAKNADEKAALADAKATEANTAAERAETASENAAAAKAEADAAAQNAAEQAELAKKAAENADEKAAFADTARENADEKAALADAKAALADAMAALADSAAQNADTKAALANTAAENADEKAGIAATATENAEAATERANTAADNAETKADIAATAATDANTAATAATESAAAANTAKTACEKAAANADTAADNADAKATEAETAAANADEKANLASAAAENADEKANLANTKAGLADEKIGVINAKIESVDAVIAKAEKAAEEANKAADNASKGIIGQATGSALGGVKADSKTENDTQPVRIDTETGKLYTAGLAKASADAIGGVKIGQNLLIDESGTLTVDAADEVSESEKPVTAAAVYVAMQALQPEIGVSGLLKGDGAGKVGAAIAGIDYVSPEDGKGLSANDYTDAEKQKLNAIETGANAYTHPEHSAYASGLYRVTIDAQGHVAAAEAVEKKDITALGIPAQDTTYQLASTDEAGLLSAADKMKLDSVETGAEKNIPPAWTAIEGKPETFMPAAHEHALGDISGLEGSLAGKVDMETGKSLSTNDYTTAEKNKLAGLSSPVSVSVTLAAASWSDGTQTVDVAGVTANSSVIVQAAPESRSAWLDADVYCSAQGAGTLTFTCADAPEADLTANVLIVEVAQ